MTEADKAEAEEFGDLWKAAGLGKVGAIRHFLHVDPESVNRKNDLGATPLQEAARSGQPGAVELLLAKAAAVDLTDNTGASALHWAACGSFEAPAVASLLLKQNADLNAKDENGATPLHYAVRFDNFPFAELLLSEGAKITIDNGGDTPLHDAATWSKKNFVELLVRHGAVVDAKNENGKKPLDLASKEEVRQLLMNPSVGEAKAVASEEKDKAEAEGCDDIWEAVCQDLLGAVRHFLHNDPKNVHHSHDGTSLLLKAVEKGNVAMAELLLSAGAVVDVLDSYGETPLHEAGRQGDLPIAQLLVSKGAALNAGNNEGSSPLHWASLQGHVSVAEFLLSKGAMVDVTDKDSNTPLHLVAGNNEVAAAELLLSKGANVDVKNDQGTTPLHEAVSKGHLEGIKLLLCNGARMDIKDHNGKIPLDLAEIDEVKELLLHPPVVNKLAASDVGPGTSSGAQDVVQQLQKDLVRLKAEKDELASSLDKAIERIQRLESIQQPSAQMQEQFFTKLDELIEKKNEGGVERQPEDGRLLHIMSSLFRCFSGKDGEDDEPARVHPQP